MRQIEAEDDSSNVSTADEDRCESPAAFRAISSIGLQFGKDSVSFETRSFVKLKSGPEIRGCATRLWRSLAVST